MSHVWLPSVKSRLWSLEAWIMLFSCEASTVVMASSKLDLCSCILSVVIIIK